MQQINEQLDEMETCLKDFIIDIDVEELTNFGKKRE